MICRTRKRFSAYNLMHYRVGERYLMANCFTGIHMYHNASNLHSLTFSVGASMCIRPPRGIRNVLFHKKRTADWAGGGPFLWYNSASRGTVTCNFFREAVEADKDGSKNEKNCSNSDELGDDRPPFDLNLAVVLAGFAFEAYTTPPEKVGVREIDPGECETVFLSDHFVREVYDGQLLIKLKRGVNFPAMDPWGTSDPYVVMQLGDCVAKSKTIYMTKDPVWNESFAINVKNPSTKYLQVAAWDSNLVTPHKRMGNAGIKLESLCDGNVHEIQLELEGIGGGGLIFLEVNYKTFEELDAEKREWRIPLLSDILLVKGLDSALKTVFGTESVKARDFVQSAFGQLRPLVDMSRFEKNQDSENGSHYELSGSTLNETKEDVLNEAEVEIRIQSGSISEKVETNIDSVRGEGRLGKRESLVNLSKVSNDAGDNANTGRHLEADSGINSDTDFWKILAGSINRTVEGFGINKVGLPAFEKFRWDGNEMIKRLGLESQTKAEKQYVETGLATPKDSSDDDYAVHSVEVSKPHLTSVDIKQASQDILRQTDNILGSLMMLTASLTGQKTGSSMTDRSDSGGNTTAIVVERQPKSPTPVKDGIGSEAAALDNGRMEEMRKMFATAESAMEAWAMLATSLGRASFIKSEFEKICFLDNRRTDTQIAIWRDVLRKRMVIAFRGTEQARWKDLRTDLMLVPTGLNPERVGGDFKEEVQVHSGFLIAYDSVRNRLLSLIKAAIFFMEGEKEVMSKWHIYVTGHSLGGALATLLALELLSSQMAKSGCIDVTMYNFGSPRVGNRRFAELYNRKVKDSWRIVNHRDIIPTVPRLMGYCHVAQPVYLTAGDLCDSSVDMELLEDGYQGDIIGESTPDVLVGEFMKGEKQLIDKLLQTEINLFRTIRDGSALMQHMEDFYYVTLLERVRSSYNPAK